MELIDEFDDEDEDVHMVRPKTCGCKESKPCSTWEKFVEWFETPL